MPPSHQQTQDLYGTMVTASDVNCSTREGTGGQTLLAWCTGAHSKDVINTISFRVKPNRSTSDNDCDNQNSMHKTILLNKLYVDPIAQYKQNWGISIICRLLGGGETTLATGNGTASSDWGNPGTTPVPAPVPDTGTTPVPVSVPGTLNWNTSPLIGGQFSPNAVSNSPWQQSPQSSSTISNNTSQTSNIGNKEQSSNPGSSSEISTIYLSTSTSQTNSQQNTTSWAQSTGKNLPVFSAPQVTGNSSSLTTTGRIVFGAVSNSQSINSPPTNGENEAVNSSTKQTNTMQAALYAQDGWGSQYVNKDSQWDVPHSPELNTKVAPLTGLTGSSGRSNINNGTDLWEATLRNNGKPPIQIPVQNAYKTSWGHTPASNIGGTWIEDDDVSSVKGRKANTSNWNIKPTTTMSNRRGQGQPPPQGLVRPPKKEIGSKGQSWNSGNTVFNDLNRPPRPINRDNGIVDHSREIGSDASDGLSGCLNGTISSSGAFTKPMWSEPLPHHVQHHVQPPSVGSPPSVISSLGVRHGQGPLPGLLSTQNNVNKHCGKADMTAAAGRNNNGSGNMGNQCPLSVPPNRVSMPPTSKMVDQQQLWPENPRNGAWGDVSGRSQNDLNVSSPWGDYKIELSENAGGLWPNSDWGPGPKSKNVLGDCSNNDMDQSFWGQKNINQNKDYISQSKPYRILAESEVKKEDVEAVKCSYNITMEESLELVSSRGLGGGGLDSSNSHTGCGLHPDDQNSKSNTNQQRFNSQQLPFAVPSVENNSDQQQVMLQKILAQQQPPAQQNTVQQQYSQGGGSRQMKFQPTAQQLMLAQQIQMAVQDGYLNNQILNQPLEPQTLFLISQLLQQIKILQQNVQAVANNPKSCPAMTTVSIAINKARQEIISLQNQIAYNQTMHMKAQEYQNPSNFSSVSSPSGLTDEQVGDFFKNDPLTLLQYSFSDLVTNKDSQISRQGFETRQQSRLNQWKLPSLDQDDLGMPNGFSRAPGANSNSPLKNTSPTFNSLLSQGDGTCTDVVARSDSGWPGNVEDNNEFWPNNLSHTRFDSMSSEFTIDQVPEFEPGKPWKGYQMKNIDNDPTITPDSVVCSPLSLAVTMEDSNNSDLLNIGGKTSPTNSQSTVGMPLFFTSPIWRYNPPPSSTQSSFNSQLGKVNEPKNNCSDGNLGNDLRGGVLGSSDKSCSPPPYLTEASDKTENATNNGWPRWPSNNTSLWQFSSNNIDSTWLLLRNLTQQIDGSTLKTLCIQHGPLLNFYMYLNHGLALIKYSTTEVAIKAQRTLNNCVFRNTTIFAELPTIAEVQMLLTFLSGGGDNTSVNNSAQQQ